VDDVPRPHSSAAGPGSSSHLLLRQWQKLPQIAFTARDAAALLQTLECRSGSAKLAIDGFGDLARGHGDAGKRQFPFDELGKAAARATIRRADRPAWSARRRFSVWLSQSIGLLGLAEQL